VSIEQQLFGPDSWLRSSSLLATAVSPSKRPLFFSLINATSGVAAVTGPILGGAVTTHLSWRWCFFLNVPIGFLAIPIIFVCYKPPLPANTVHKAGNGDQPSVDALSIFLIAVGVIFLVLALQWSNHRYAWGDLRVMVLAATATLLIGSFFHRQWQLGEAALAPPRILGQRSIGSGCWYIFCMGGSQIVVEYFVRLHSHSLLG
jgi:MFS family permease